MAASWRMRSSTPSSASHASTLSSRRANWGRPSRQGTHFPQVCAMPACSKDSCVESGQSPGGVASTRRIKRSTTVPTLASSFARGALDSSATFISPIEVNALTRSAGLTLKETVYSTSAGERAAFTPSCANCGKRHPSRTAPPPSPFCLQPSLRKDSAVRTRGRRCSPPRSR